MDRRELALGLVAHCRSVRRPEGLGVGGPL